MLVNNITTVKVMYKDQEFTVIPRGCIVLGIRAKQQMAAYVQSIGDIAFVVDNELYVSESGMFHLSMKHCDTYNFI